MLRRRDCQRLQASAARARVILVRLETISRRDIEGYARCTGYPDCTRWYDLPRSSSCPWYGYLLCIRLRRDQDRRREEGIFLGGYTFHEGDYISLDGTTGKDLQRRYPDSGRLPLAETSRGSWTGPTASVSWAFVPTQIHRPDTANAVKLGAEGYRPLPYRAYVLRARENPQLKER